MMQRMLENNFQPTEATFAMALMSAGRVGRADFAKVLFDWRHASGLGPRQEIYSSVSAVGEAVVGGAVWLWWWLLWWWLLWWWLWLW